MLYAWYIFLFVFSEKFAFDCFRIGFVAFLSDRLTKKCFSFVFFQCCLSLRDCACLFWFVCYLFPDTPITGLWYFIDLVSMGEIKPPEGIEEGWKDPSPLPLRVLALVKWILLVLFQV